MNALLGVILLLLHVSVALLPIISTTSLTNVSMFTYIVNTVDLIQCLIYYLFTLISFIVFTIIVGVKGEYGFVITVVVYLTTCIVLKVFVVVSLWLNPIAYYNAIGACSIGYTVCNVFVVSYTGTIVCCATDWCGKRDYVEIE